MTDALTLEPAGSLTPTRNRGGVLLRAGFRDLLEHAGVDVDAVVDGQIVRSLQYSLDASGEFLVAELFDEAVDARETDSARQIGYSGSSPSVRLPPAACEALGIDRDADGFPPLEAYVSAENSVIALRPMESVTLDVDVESGELDGTDRSPPTWTEERCVDVLLEEFGSAGDFPPIEEYRELLQGREDLPSVSVLYERFGGKRGWLDAMESADSENDG